MKETLSPGDRIIVVKFPFRKVRRGDMVLFRHNNENLIKRCVAIPGDTVTINDGDIFINRMLIKSNFPNITKLSSQSRAMRAFESHRTFRTEWDQYSLGPLVVPNKGDFVSKSEVRPYLHILNKKRIITDQITFDDEYYFFVGDNRNASIDSRMFGLVGSKDIIGLCFKRNF